MTVTKKNVSNEKVYVFKINEDLLPLLEEAKSIIDNSKKHNDADTSDLKLETDDETYQSKIKSQESNSLLSNPKLEPLHSWFQECINLAMKDLDLEKQELEITHSWGNLFNKLEYSNKHTDKNSLMTGVFAVTNGWNKKFFLNYSRGAWYKMMLYHADHLNHYIELEAGKLILFPSSVPHGSTPGDEQSKSAYTISFNTFLKGFQKQNLNYKEIENSI